jgi:hypothetical protein
MGLSIRAYARQRGVSDMAVRKAIKSGRIPKEPDGSIDPVKADAAWDRNSNPAQQHKPLQAPKPQLQQPIKPSVKPLVQQPSSPKTVGPDFQTSRAVKETYAAKMAKLDFEERTKGLISADEVRVSAFNLARRVRDRLLLIPHRLAAILAAEMDADKVEKLLEDELRKALEELTK